MVMKGFVKAFPTHIDEAIKIADKIDISINKNNIDNIVISGQGGSAIGGLIVKNLLKEESSIPIIINQDYAIPAFVNERTLFIASSYSGDTEETISALKKAESKKSNIFCICSGGEILKISKERDYNYILIPTGGAPRAMLCYSIVQILFLVFIINNKSKEDLKGLLLSSKDILKNQQNNIVELANSVVSKISNKMPFIYTFPEFEGVALRFKQQLNENSKRHACYNIIPEMNHNEIVAWHTKNVCVIPVFLKGLSSPKNQERMNINIQQIKENVDNIIELSATGSYFNQFFYFIHLVDWISVIIAEKENIDPNKIDAIDYLKKKLKK